MKVEVDNVWLTGFAVGKGVTRENKMKYATKHTEQEYTELWERHGIPVGVGNVGDLLSDVIFDLEEQITIAHRFCGEERKIK